MTESCLPASSFYGQHDTEQQDQEDHFMASRQQVMARNPSQHQSQGITTFSSTHTTKTQRNICTTRTSEQRIQKDPKLQKARNNQPLHLQKMVIRVCVEDEAIHCPQLRHFQAWYGQKDAIVDLLLEYPPIMREETAERNLYMNTSLDDKFVVCWFCCFF